MRRGAAPTSSARTASPRSRPRLPDRADARSQGSRALNGTPRQIRKNGEVIAEESIPSDRLLMFLLQRYDSMRYGKLSGLLPVPVPDPTDTARAEMPRLLKTLRDQPDLPDYDHHESFDVLR